MLVSLSHFTNETQKEVIRRLFQMGDVNVRAKQVIKFKKIDILICK